jgi:Ca-activated chloride channel family protein
MRTFRPILATALAGLLALLPHFGAPAQAGNVKLEADLGQRLVPTSGGKVYLRLSLQAIAERKAERRTPVNVALVLDRSGSMAGPRIVAAKEAANMALGRLSRDDIVALVAYNHEVDVLAPARRLGAQDGLAGKIGKLTADGRTALHAGVVAGSKEVARELSEKRVNRVILLSDGLANVGPSTPKELADLGRELGAKGISVTTIGLGLDYNEDLMQRLAAASDGNHAFVEHAEDLGKIFDAEFGDALSIAAKDVEITVECRIGFKPVRVLGRSAEISGNRISLKLNQLQGANERYVVVELEAPAGQSPGAADIASVRIDYLDLDNATRASADKTVNARFTASKEEAEASLDKSVMSQVSEQVATEANEMAVELRDKGDVVGARKALEDNAAYLKRAKERYGTGAGAAAPTSVGRLDDLEKKNREAATNLEAGQWEKTRKSMRQDQHKSKVQQAY